MLALSSERVSESANERMSEWANGPRERGLRRMGESANEQVGESAPRAGSATNARREWGYDEWAVRFLGERLCIRADRWLDLFRDTCELCK